MGCCLSKKNSSSSSPPSLVLPGDSHCSVKPSDPNKSAIPAAQEKLEVEDSKPRNEVQQEVALQQNDKIRKEVFVIKHRRSHERSKTTDPEDSTASASEEKSTGSPVAPVVKNSSYTKDEVDAILIQCGRLSRSNSAANKTRRYSGSKRSFDFDQNERSRDGDAEEADAEDGGEEETERRMNRQRHRSGDRVNSSPRERRRRTPSREREDSKSCRSGSRERGSGNSGSRRVSRSPGRRTETNPNPVGSGSSVNSSNNRPGKFVSVPATDKASLAMDKSTNGEPAIKRITVKRNAAASPRSQSPARAAINTNSNVQPSPPLSRNGSRKAEHSPYRRNPLGEIDPNSLAYPPSQGEKLGSGNANCNKKRMNRENEGQGVIKESGNFVGQKLNPGMNTGSTRTAAAQASTCRAASPSRATKERQEAVEELKIVSSVTELAKPQVISRSRSLRKSRDFDFSPETLLSNHIDSNNNNVAAVSTLPSYTALLLEDIQNFHQKSVNVNTLTSFNLPPSVSKACSIVEAVADLNSTTNASPAIIQHQRAEFNFTSAAKKTADLMEPSFEKYVTVKRGGSMEEMEDQESSGSNSFTGSSCVVQRQRCSSSSSWEPNSAESTDRVNLRSNNKERDRSPLGFQRKDVSNLKKQEFDPLKKGNVGRKRVAVVDSSSNKGVIQATTRVAALSM